MINLTVAIIGALLIIIGFVGIILMYLSNKIKQRNSQNKVHFYVTRESKYGIVPNLLILWIGKPERYNDGWTNTKNGVSAICCDKNFKYFSLDYKKFKKLKFEDEPVEVFLNLED